MNFLSLFIVCFIATFAPILGVQHNFLLKDIDTNEILIQEGDLSTRRCPYCSFNIALSLMGFDSKTLQDTENPVWPFQDKYELEYSKWNDGYPQIWKGEHYPKTWMKNSCLWFSQEITQKMGITKFTHYIAAFEYGNQNLTGDAGKNNGLTNAWLGSSLKISPTEQINFISKLVKHELPVSEQAHELTKAILFVEKLPNEMKLYGKTGSGDFGNGRDQPELYIGWYVGWVEKDNKRLAFAYIIQGDKNNTSISGSNAREHLKKRLLKVFANR